MNIRNKIKTDIRCIHINNIKVTASQCIHICIVLQLATEYLVRYVHETHKINQGKAKQNEAKQNIAYVTYAYVYFTALSLSPIPIRPRYFYLPLFAIQIVSYKLTRDGTI